MKTLPVLQMQTLSDIKLIRHCLHNDHNAFDELVKRHENKVYNIAYRMLGNHEDALDASQDAFIRLYKSLSSYARRASFSTWVYRITINVCLDFLKKNRRHELSASELNVNDEDNTLLDESLGTEPDPQEELARKEERQLLHAAIAELPTDYRTIVVLCDIQELSYKETAKTLNLPIGTVKSRLNRARLTLGNILKTTLEQFLHEGLSNVGEDR